MPSWIKLLIAPNTRGLFITMFIAFVLQIILLGALIYERNISVSEATQTFHASELFDIADLVATLESEQRNTLERIVNTPYARIGFHESLPSRASVSAFERLIGMNMRRIHIPSPSGDYMVIEFNEALRETYGFFSQIGLLILCFFLIISMVLARARAALQPVHRFAETAKRLSQDLHAPPMRVEGSRDLKKAAIAVNRMQIALQEQVAGRTRLIAGIGHDLRTFITRLTLRTDFIADEVQRQKALRDLNQMTHVVNQSLELGKTDQITDPIETADISLFMLEVVEAFVEAGAPLTLSSIPSIHVSLRQTSLQRAIHNLIENAIRYGDAAHLSAVIDGRRLLIHIDDEGPGIPEHRRQEVLRPFVRMEESRNRNTGGTGLGLTLAQSLIFQQGGDLILDDAPTGGLRATISLKIAC